MDKKDKDTEDKKAVAVADKKQPHTLETLRLTDQTIVTDFNSEEDKLILQDLDRDEFAAYFRKEIVPKIAITYSDTAGTETRWFGQDLQKIIPNSKIYNRQHADVKDIVKAGINHNFTDILIINTNKRKPNGLLHIHLPNGPTAYYKLSNVRPIKTMATKRKPINFAKCRPEVITNRFQTRLGKTIERMISSIFPHESDLKAKRVLTFHNQRDYIFFRHYYYVRRSNGEKVRVHELGPRFTLKLRSLQLGTFDSKCGEYEWIIEDKRHQMETSRRKFFL